MTKNVKQFYIYNLMMKVNTLDSGVGFGEKAIKNKNNKWEATVIANEECYLAALDKENYEKFMADATKRETEWKIKVVELYPVFNKFVRKVKTELLLYLTFMDVKVNHVLFKEKDAADYVYFIIEGKFEITKTIFFER